MRRNHGASRGRAQQASGPVLGHGRRRDGRRRGGVRARGTRFRRGAGGRRRAARRRRFSGRPARLRRPAPGSVQRCGRGRLGRPAPGHRHPGGPGPRAPVRGRRGQRRRRSARRRRRDPDAVVAHRPRLLRPHGGHPRSGPLLPGRARRPLPARASAAPSRCPDLLADAHRGADPAGRRGRRSGRLLLELRPGRARRSRRRGPGGGGRGPAGARRGGPGGPGPRRLHPGFLRDAIGRSPRAESPGAHP